MSAVEARAGSEVPAALADYLAELQHRALELQGMLQLLESTADDDRIGGAIGIAAREARELNVALDCVVIRRVLKEAAEAEQAARDEAEIGTSAEEGVAA